MQKDLAASHPELDVRLLGVNKAGQEPGNGLITAGADIPWLQDLDADLDGDSDTWESWTVTLRDTIVLDARNVPVAVMNLTTHDLADPTNYAKLVSLLLGAAETAAATERNAGTNPASHAALSLPVLGGTYSASVDLAGTTGHPLAWLVGYSTPATLSLDGGRTLLVNVADATGELLGLAPLAGPVATWNLPVPSDVAFVGLPAFTQAVHLGGGTPFALSNAQDLQIGY